MEIISDQGREFLGEVNAILTKGRVIHRTTSAYRAQANGMIEHLNGALGRALVATLEKEDKRTWERGLSDFLIGYGGLRHASTGRSPHELLTARPMRLPWKFCAMPRPMIPDNQPAPALEEYMVKMQASLQVLHDSAKDAILER